MPILPQNHITQPINADDKATLKNPQVQQFILAQIAQQLTSFPGYAFIRHITLTDAWGGGGGAMVPLPRP